MHNAQVELAWLKKQKQQAAWTLNLKYITKKNA